MDSAGEHKAIDGQQTRNAQHKLMSGLELGLAIFVFDFLGIFGEAVALMFNSFLGNGDSEAARDVLEDDVVHYSFRRSCFDVVVLAFVRTVLLSVFIRFGTANTNTAQTRP